MRGQLITFEGVEGSGKSTQIRLAHQWLQWHIPNTILTHEPGGTSLGSALREILLHSGEEIADRAELLLYAADRAQHVSTVILPALRDGAVVLCDRFSDSTMAYQGYGRGLSLRLIDRLNQIATDGLEPDLTVWLDVDVKVGLERAKSGGKGDRIEQADIAFHQRVQEGFDSLWRCHPDRIVRVDASGDEKTVSLRVQDALKGYLQLVGYRSAFV